MKIVKKKEAKEFKNNEICTAFEYDLKDNEINAAVIKLKGRYPVGGTVMNEKCKEIVYILKGSGKLVVEGVEVELSEGDQALILPGEKYFFDGNMIFLAPCTPAWYPEQHKKVE